MAEDSTAQNASDLSRRDLCLEDWLFAQPYTFELFQALRLLEQFAHSRSHSGVAAIPLGQGSDPSREAVRLRADAAFTYPSSEIAALDRGDPGPPELTSHLFALAGTAGPLPDWVAELLLRQSQLRDFALRDFLDLFHHRILSLLYRAHIHHRPWLEPVQAPSHEPDTTTRARNRMSQRLLALLGLGLPELQGRLGVGDAELLPYAALLWQKPRSLPSLERILAHALGVPVQIIPMLGRWLALEPSDYTLLGARATDELHPAPSRGRNHALGRTATLGTRAWDFGGRFDLVLGPVPFAGLIDFLPGAAAYLRLTTLVRLFSGPLPEVRLHLRVLTAEHPNAVLDGPPASSFTAALGQTTWLRPLAPRAGAPVSHLVALGSLPNPAEA